MFISLSIEAFLNYGVYSQANFTLINNCSYTVWPAILSIGTAQIPTTGFVLEKGESKSFLAPKSWRGRFWGRTYCSENSTGNFSCITGDCGSGKVECSNRISTPPTTIVEFTVNANENLDYYDISLVDGYNLPIVVEPQSGSRTNCTNIGCSTDLNGECPEELQVLSSGIGTVACKNACDALRQDRYCCNGAYNSPSTCKPTLYSEVFKKACPTASSYAYDEASGVFFCARADYLITFCPSADSTASAASSPPPIAASTPPPTTTSRSAPPAEGPTGSLASSPPPIAASTPPPPTTPRSSPPATGPGGSLGNGGLPAAAIIAIIVGIIFSIILFTVAFCFLRRKAKKNYPLTMKATGNVDGNEISEVESLKYDLTYIKAATNNFSADNKIGEGGFGEVFKGTLDTGQQVAVKRLSKSSGQGDQEFKNEVIVVAKLQHRNLVRLLGYCVENEEKILMYEYVPNESLDFILFDEEKKQALDWSRRYNIIGGVARGILYLHVDSRLRIIHRDIKASNVLLDRDMNAKISDFGLAKIVGFDESQGNTRRVVGTFGYMSPEYITQGKFSVKSDVFSFGVLVLEIISGKKNNRFYQSSEHLLSYAWKLWSDGKPLDLVDPSLGDSLIENEVSRCIHIGLLCVQEDLDERPTMTLVVLMLSSSSMTLPIPHQPAFFLQGAKMRMSNPPDPEIFSANGLSITEFSPR